MSTKGKPKAITAELLVDEVRFLLKTLLRDDLFGERVALVEAEKLLDHSLSVPFADYCAFLRGRGLIRLDRATGTVLVEPRGKSAAVGGPDPDLIAALAAHFSDRIVAGSSRMEHRSAKLDPGSLADPGVTQPLPVMKGDDPVLPPPAVDLPPSERPFDVGSRYDLGMQIGEGSIGVVYKAEDLTLGRSVALKQMRHVFDYVTYLPAEELRRRLKETTLAQAALSSPHILEVVDLDFEAPVPHVVMKWARGGNLQQRLDRAGALGETLPIDVVLRILVQCTNALAHAHEAGVLHGGLKPENVLFDEAGNVLLSDFGLAQATAKGALTGPPVYVGAGSTSYMAPEQLHAEKTSAPGDLYALGILLYQMLTGHLPGRRSPMPSEKNKKAPKGIDDIFDVMTRDEVSERYPTAEALLEALSGTLPKKHGIETGSLVLWAKDPWPLPDLPPESPAEAELTDAALQLDASSVDDAALGLSSDEEAALASIPSEELPPEDLVSAEAESIDAAEA